MGRSRVDEELEKFSRRMDSLPLESSISEHSPALVPQFLEQLAAALEALQVAHEELSEQNKKLLQSRDETEQERQHYHDLFDFAPHGYLLTDLCGSIREANRAASTLLNVSQPCLIAKPLALYIAEQDRRFFRTQLSRLRSGETVGEWQLHLHPRKGSPFPVAITVTSVTDNSAGELIGFRWLLRDRTQQQSMQDTLCESNEILQALFQASPLAIITLDREGHIGLRNQAAVEMFGWLPLESQSFSLVPEELTQNFQEILRQLLRGQTFMQVEMTHQRSNGERFPVRCSMAPLRNALGDTIGCVSVITDISEQRRMESELRQAQQRLAESREAERLHLARELHDSVLQQIMGMRYLLAETRRKGTKQAWTGEDSDEMMQMVTDLQRETLEAVTQLRRVISELRPPGLEEFGLKLALEGFVAQLQRQIGGGMPKIQFTCEGPELTLLPSAALCLFRVTQEALRNAVKHARASQVTLSLALGPEGVHLTIQDDGRGFQVPPCPGELTQEGHFGLIGMEERVRGLGGELTIHSESGQGTTIDVRIPFDGY